MKKIAANKTFQGRLNAEIASHRFDLLLVWAVDFVMAFLQFLFNLFTFLFGRHFGQADHIPDC